MLFLGGCPGGGYDEQRLGIVSVRFHDANVANGVLAESLHVSLTWPHCCTWK